MRLYLEIRAVLSVLSILSVLWFWVEMFRKDSHKKFVRMKWLAFCVLNIGLLDCLLILFLGHKNPGFMDVLVLPIWLYIFRFYSKRTKPQPIP